MPSLGEIDKVALNITNGQLSTVKALHLIAYGVETEPRKTRKSCREFSGYGLEIESDEYAQKIQDVKENVDVSDLISVCDILELNHKGNVDTLVNRICSFMNDLNLTEDGNGFEGEDVIEDDAEESDEASEEDDEDENLAIVQSRLRAKKESASFSLTFRDIEDSIRHFDGKSDYPVRKWIDDFEEMAEITGWNDLQKLIFAKKSLRGLAKLFVQSEKGVKSCMVFTKEKTYRRKSK